MTEPSRPSPETHGTEAEAAVQLDPTLAHPVGNVVRPSFGKRDSEPDFGPPEKPGEIGSIDRYRVLKKLGQGGMGAVYLDFGGTRIGDAGLENFKGCAGLTTLSLHGTAATDRGLDNFQGSGSLKYLRLSDTQVTDAGLMNFKGCTELAHLDLNGTAVTAAGLAPFKDCANLTTLFVRGTKVTKDGAAELATALPRCRIEWDGGTIEPKK